MEKGLRSSQIVILTGLSCVLLACLVASPVVFGCGGGGCDDPAVEASMLAETHLERALGEIQRTGDFSAVEKTIVCSSGDCSAVYTMETEVARGPSGKASRISIRVRWKGAFGGGVVVATGVCSGCGAVEPASMDGGTAASEKLAHPE